MLSESLAEVDPEIFQAIQNEVHRLQNKLQMIASENYTPLAVLEAQGSVMTIKYAEGYPGRRYYGGCEFVDVAENLAIERAKKLFGAEHANVQPHSGTQANMAVYFAVLKPGDTILAMDLAHGGHLTHGSPANFSGKLFNFVHYGVHPKTELIDYDQVRDLARKHRPKMIVAGASAYPREIDFRPFREICDEVGAYLCVDMAHFAGLVVGGVHQSPVPHAEFVTSTTHKTLRGPRGAFILCREEFAKAIDSTVMPGIQGGPLMHVIAAKAVCFKLAMEPEFKEYQRQIVRNSRALAAVLQEEGLRLVSGGTDTHLLLVDLNPLGITGKEAERLLDEVGIVVNKNLIPFDTRGPTVTSGIRIGTPAVTSRGMKEAEMEEIGRIIARVLKNPHDEKVKAEAQAQVRELCQRFPIYEDLVARV